MILYDVIVTSIYVSFGTLPSSKTQRCKILVRVMSEAVTSYLVGFQRVPTLLKLKSYWIQDRWEYENTIGRIASSTDSIVFRFWLRTCIYPWRTYYSYYIQYTVPISYTDPHARAPLYVLLYWCYKMSVKSQRLFKSFLCVPRIYYIWEVRVESEQDFHGLLLRLSKCHNRKYFVVTGKVFGIYIEFVSTY